MNHCLWLLPFALSIIATILIMLTGWLIKRAIKFLMDGGGVKLYTKIEYSPDEAPYCFHVYFKNGIFSLWKYRDSFEDLNDTIEFVESAIITHMIYLDTSK